MYSAFFFSFTVHTASERLASWLFDTLPPCSSPQRLTLTPTVRRPPRPTAPQMGPLPIEHAAEMTFPVPANASTTVLNLIGAVVSFFQVPGNAPASAV